MTDDDDYSPAMTHWFGTAWPSPELPAPVCSEERFHIVVPVDETCMGCEQPILVADSGARCPVIQGELMNPPHGPWGYYHAECWLRNVMCPVCMGLTPGPHSDDPAGRRDEGRLLMAYAREHAV